MEAFTGWIPSARKHLHDIPVSVNCSGKPNLYIALPLYIYLFFPLPEQHSLHFLSALHRISEFSVTSVLGHYQAQMLHWRAFGNQWLGSCDSVWITPSWTIWKQLLAGSQPILANHFIFPTSLEAFEFHWTFSSFPSFVDFGPLTFHPLYYSFLRDLTTQ